MTDTVKDGLNVDQVSKDLAVPGTPNSNISHDNGEGLGEDLIFMAGTPNSSGRASLAEEGPKKPPIPSGKFFSMNSAEDEEADSDYNSGATLVREKTAEALTIIDKEHEFNVCCSLCDEDPSFPLDCACQTCGEFPATHHGICCKASRKGSGLQPGTKRWRNFKKKTR